MISIVMPCYNCAETIEASIASVMEQTYSDWELIVIDDGSTDKSADCAREIHDPRVVVLAQENRGQTAARNAGIRRAAGDYIAFLDSDDTWHPEFLDAMYGALSVNPDAVLAYCGWQNLGVQGGRGKPFVPPNYENIDRIELLLGGCRWPIHAVLLRSEVARGVGGFDETLSSCEDYDFWLRTTVRGRIIRVPQVLAYYHHHGGNQVTKDRWRIAVDHLMVQRKFIAANRVEVAPLGRRRLRDLLHGELLRRAYSCYWDRDLACARKLFRQVMRSGYGSWKDWKYMLPSLLPISLHRALLQVFAKPSVNHGK